MDVDALVKMAQDDPVAANALLREVTRLECAKRFPSAGALAHGLDPRNNRQVAWLEKVDQALEWAFHTPHARLMISVPSQQGKSTRAAVWGSVRALILNPNRRIIVCTHSQDLALTHSEKIRSILATFGTGSKDALTGALLPDRLGIGLGAKTAAGRWQLSNADGGVVAVGTGTALPGKPADVMILDDLHASMEAADSPAEQRRLRLWWDSVASQRLAPGSPVIVIGTRWSTQDIFSYLIAQEPDKWRVLNFPAISEHGVLDSLNREPGIGLVSARGEIDWAYQRQIKPLRVWTSTFQGSPVPMSGGMFLADWFDDHRIFEMPDINRRIVAVDPSDSGHGDKCGIIAMSLDTSGRVIIHDDESAVLTSAEWAKRAVALAIRVGASELVYEGYSASTTYGDVIAAAAKIMGASVRISPWRGRGNAQVRSTGLRHALETGKAVMFGHRCPQLEADACRWWGSSQHCPDSVAALVVGYSHLTQSQPMTIAPVGWAEMPTGLPGDLWGGPSFGGFGALPSGLPGS